MSVLLNFRTSVQQGSTEQKVKKLERTAEGTQRDGKREAVKRMPDSTCRPSMEACWNV